MEIKAITQDPNVAEYELSGGVVHPWHVDQLGHMNVRWYAHFFDDASFLLWNRLGLDQTKMKSEFGIQSVTASATTQFKKELLSGACVRVHGAIARIGGKSLTLKFRLADAASGEEHATYETVEVFVDATSHKSVEIPNEIRKVLETARARMRN